MKHFLLLLALVCHPIAVNAAGIPFSEALENALNINGAQLNGNAEGRGIARTARVQYDVVADGGTINTNHRLGVVLPANTVIQQGYWYTDTQFVGTSSKVAIGCLNGSGSSTVIFTAADITGNAVAAIVATNATGTAATMIDLGTSSCEVVAGNTTATSTAGKMTLFLDYVTHQ